MNVDADDDVTVFSYTAPFFLVTEQGRGDREGKGRGREGKKGEWVGEWPDRGMS